MEHWAQKCDGSGVDPAEYAAVCRERDRLQAELQSVIAKLHETESERDALTKIVAQSLTACESCKHEHLGLPCGDLSEALECEDCQLKRGLCCTRDSGNHFEFKGVEEAK